MREILFRGKTIKGDKWIYGCFTKHNNECFIKPQGTKTMKFQQVVEQSVGQFTDSYYPNSKDKIFEGDILSISRDITIDYLNGTINIEEKNSYEIVAVSFEKSSFACFGKVFITIVSMIGDKSISVEKMGTLYEDPELLELNN